MKMPSMSRTILPLLAVAAIVISAIVIFSSSPDRSLEEAEATPAKNNNLFGGAAVIAGSGVVEPSSELIDIGADVSGIVERVLVSEGDRVTAGQTLFVMDGRQVRASISEAQAAIKEADAQIAEARTNAVTARQQLALFRKVDDKRAISRQEVIRVEGDAANADARLRAAQAARAAALSRRSSAQTELSRFTIKAPISGEVLAVDIRPGEFVQASGNGGNNAAIMQIGETSPLYVRIDIDENQIDRVAPGQEAVLSPRGNADRKISASYVSTEPQIVPKTSLTNRATERVDVRVLQLLYQLPADSGLSVGQQVDAFLRAKKSGGSDQSGSANTGQSAPESAQ